MKMVMMKKRSEKAIHKYITDQIEKVNPAGVMNIWYLSEILPTVAANKPLSRPAQDPAIALNVAVSMNVATVVRIRPMLRGE